MIFNHVNTPNFAGKSAPFNLMRPIRCFEPFSNFCGIDSSESMAKTAFGLRLFFTLLAMTRLDESLVSSFGSVLVIAREDFLLSPDLSIAHAAGTAERSLNRMLVDSASTAQPPLTR